MKDYKNKYVILKAVDDSIEKWKAVVYFGIYQKCGTFHCPLCELFCTYYNINLPPYSSCSYCPVYLYTGSKQCLNTSYYGTSLPRLGNYNRVKNKTRKQKDNNMLSELYEIRREFIVNFFIKKG